MLRKISNVLTVIGAILILWIGASCIDYIDHNNPFDDDYRDYWEYNFFDLIYGW